MRHITDDDIAFAERIAKGFARRHHRRHEVDEILGEARLRLVVGAREYNPAGTTWRKFLLFYIWSRLLDWQRAQYKTRSHGKDVTLVSLTELLHFDNGQERNTIIGEIDIAESVVSEQDVAAFLERLSEKEWAIVRQRAHGVPIKVIAEKFDVTPSRISQIFSGIAKRARAELVA